MSTRPAAPSRAKKTLRPIVNTVDVTSASVTLFDEAHQGGGTACGLLPPALVEHLLEAHFGIEQQAMISLDGLLVIVPFPQDYVRYPIRKGVARLAATISSVEARAVRTDGRFCSSHQLVPRYRCASEVFVHVCTSCRGSFRRTSRPRTHADSSSHTVGADGIAGP